MIKLIVADDEKWVRTSIVESLPMDELGLVLAREASNGLEALESCKELEPDILITDIMMPGLTGIELIKELKSSMPQLKVIIVSGYSDFEYAKAAIKYGVQDFILKPVDDNELKQIFTKLVENIHAERRSKDEERMRKTKYEVYSGLEFQRFLNRLIRQNSFTVDNIKKRLSECDIDFKNPYYSVIVFRPFHPKDFSSGNYQEKCRAVVAKALEEYTGGITFLGNGPELEIVSIVNHHSELITGEGNNTSLFYDTCNVKEPMFPDTLNMINNNLGEYSLGKLYVGISPRSQQINALPELYTHACNALQFKFWEPEKNLFLHQTSQSQNAKGLKIDDGQMDEIALKIKFRDINPAFKLIESMCFDFYVHGRIQPDIVKEYLSSVVQDITSRLNIHLSFVEYETNLTGKHPYEVLKTTDSIVEFKSIIHTMLCHISDHYFMKNTVNEQCAVELAKKMIDENYMSDVSLESVANLVHFNPAYFSVLFKKETGISYVDYKTQKRIENSKRFLANANFTINEVSLKVGYSDPKYFSKLFKKVTGMSISEYREEAKKGNPV